MKVIGRLHEQGSVLRGDAEPARLPRLMCFTEKALAGNTPMYVHQALNGQAPE